MPKLTGYLDDGLIIRKAQLLKLAFDTLEELMQSESERTRLGAASKVAELILGKQSQKKDSSEAPEENGHLKMMMSRPK